MLLFSPLLHNSMPGALAVRHWTLTFTFTISIHYSPVEYRIVQQCDHRTEKDIFMNILELT